MGLLDKMWDEVVAGPPPDNGLGKLRKSPTIHETDPDAALRRMALRRSSAEFERSQEEARQVTKGIAIAKPSKYFQRSLSMDGSPPSPSSPTDGSPLSPSSSSGTPREKENVWRSVFNPGSNRATRHIGSEKFDKAEPNSPTVYDWLYSGETKSKWR